MSVDLGAIFDTVAPILATAIPSAGTKVEILRGAKAGTVDPDTLLEVGAVPGVTVAQDVPCLLNPASTRGSQGDPFPAAVRVGREDYQATFLPDVVDLLEGDVLLVTASRDPRMLLKQYKLGTILDATAGLLRVCVATPVRRGVSP